MKAMETAWPVDLARFLSRMSSVRFARFCGLLLEKFLQSGRDTLRWEPPGVGCGFHIHPGESPHAIQCRFELKQPGKGLLRIWPEHFCAALSAKFCACHLRF